MTSSKKGIRARFKSDFHGRMLIIDDMLIIGSADLDSQGLTVHNNIAIQSDSSTAVQRSLEIFHELERESEAILIT